MNLSRYFRLLVAGLSLCMSLGALSTNALALPVPKFAYVANSGSDTVSVYTINPTTGALTAGTAVAAGTGPSSITVDPSGRFAYVANSGSNNISVYTIDQTTGALTAGTAITAGTWPNSFAVDPSGRFAYVANSGSSDISVYTIDQTTGALTAGTAVAAGTFPGLVTVDPSGRFAYVANDSQNGSTVLVYTIDQTTGALTASDVVAAGIWPNSFAVDPSGRFAYVGDCHSFEVKVYTIDQTTGALTAGTAAAAGTCPSSVAVDPSGRFAYIANFSLSSSTVLVYTIDQTTGALTASDVVAAGIRSISVTVDPSGRFAYVANYGSDNVSAYTINPSTGALTAGSVVATGTVPRSVTTTAGFTGTTGASFGVAPTITVGGTGTISATATSGTAINFSSLTPSVCTIIGSTVASITAGTCVIAADQAGITATQAPLIFTIGSAASQTTIADARVFAYAEAKYPNIFTGTPTPGAYPPYNYNYYPVSGNYLAVDTSGTIFVLGPFTKNVVTSVAPKESFRIPITAWESTQAGNPCNTPPATPTGFTVTRRQSQFLMNDFSWNPVIVAPNDHVTYTVRESLVSPVTSSDSAQLCVYPTCTGAVSPGADYYAVEAVNMCGLRSAFSTTISAYCTKGGTNGKGGTSGGTLGRLGSGCTPTSSAGLDYATLNGTWMGTWHYSGKFPSSVCTNNFSGAFSLPIKGLYGSASSHGNLGFFSVASFSGIQFRETSSTADYMNNYVAPSCAVTSTKTQTDIVSGDINGTADMFVGGEAYSGRITLNGNTLTGTFTNTRGQGTATFTATMQ